MKETEIGMHGKENYVCTTVVVLFREENRNWETRMIALKEDSRYFIDIVSI
jgi:hypothetical protein